MRMTWTIDSQYVDVPSRLWTWNETDEGGLEKAELAIPDHVLRALPMRPEQDMEVRGVGHLNRRYKGEVILPPRLDPETGLWHITCDGPRRDADLKSIGLLFQSRDAENFKPSNSFPHNYPVPDGFRLDSMPGAVQIGIDRGEVHPTGDRGRMVSWWPGRLVLPTKVLATLTKNRTSGEHVALIRRGTGPSGTMTQDGASFPLTSGSDTTVNRTLASPSDQIELVLEVEDGDQVIASNRAITSDEDISIKTSGAQGAGTHFGSSNAVDDGLDSINITLDVSASSGTDRSLEVEIQTALQDGEWRTVGTLTRTTNGTSTLTIADQLRDKIRYKSKITGDSAPSFTYSIVGETVPAKIVYGDWETLDADVTSAEITLTVDSLTGTDKELEIAIQTKGGDNNRERTVGQFDTFTSTGTDTITVDNLHKRMRFVARIYGTNEPSAQFDITAKLGYTHLRTTWSEVRVNAISSGDTETIESAMVYVGDELTWGTSGVSSSLSQNCLPLDWVNEAWTEFFTYLSGGLVDGWWGVWPGEGWSSELKADKWANSETVHLYRGFGAQDELGPLETFDDVLVTWENGKGVEHHYPRVIDPALSYYPVRLADIQSNDDLAQAVRTELLDDVTEERYAGRIRVTRAFRYAGGGEIDPHDIRPGWKAVLHDFGPLRSEVVRITDATYDFEGATFGIDDTTSEERHQNRERLRSQRKAGRKRTRIPQSLGPGPSPREFSVLA